MFKCGAFDMLIVIDFIKIRSWSWFFQSLCRVFLLFLLIGHWCMNPLQCISICS